MEKESFRSYITTSLPRILSTDGGNVVNKRKVLGSIIHKYIDDDEVKARVLARNPNKEDVIKITNMYYIKKDDEYNIPEDFTVKSKKILNTFRDLIRSDMCRNQLRECVCIIFRIPCVHKINSYEIHFPKIADDRCNK